MTHLIKEYLLFQNSQIWFAGLGLTIFVCLFAGWLLWVFRRGSSSIYDRMSRLPLTEPSSEKENLNHV